MYVIRDILGTMRRLSARQCKPTHLELSPADWKQIATTVGVSEKSTQLLGLRIIVTEGFGIPSVQWRPDNTKVHQEEFIMIPPNDSPQRPPDEGQGSQ